MPEVKLVLPNPTFPNVPVLLKVVPVVPVPNRPPGFVWPKRDPPPPSASPVLVPVKTKALNCFLRQIICVSSNAIIHTETRWRNGCSSKREACSLSCRFQWWVKKWCACVRSCAKACCGTEWRRGRCPKSRSISETRRSHRLSSENRSAGVRRSGLTESAKARIRRRDVKCRLVLIE